MHVCTYVASQGFYMYMYVVQYSYMYNLRQSWFNTATCGSIQLHVVQYSYMWFNIATCIMYVVQYSWFNHRHYNVMLCYL